MCLYAESSLAHRREVRGVQPGLLCVVDDIRPHRPLRARMFMFVRQECRCWLPQTAAKTPPGTGDRPSPTNAQEQLRVQARANTCTWHAGAGHKPTTPQQRRHRHGTTAQDETSQATRAGWNAVARPLDRFEEQRTFTVGKKGFCPGFHPGGIVNFEKICSHIAKNRRFLLILGDTLSKFTIRSHQNLESQSFLPTVASPVPYRELSRLNPLSTNVRAPDGI